MIKKIGLIAVSSAIVFAPFLAQADTIKQYVSFGMTNSDVSSVQSFLGQDVTLYPQGLVTGYFGALTKSAVINFQVRNNIVTSSTDVGAGRVGPATLPVMNAQILGGMTTNMAPVITSVSTNPGRTAATIGWTTNENTRGMVYYSTSPLSLGEHANSVDVSGMTATSDNDYHVSQNVSIANLMPNTVYYYLVYTTDQTGTVSVTWPATFQTTN